MLKNLPANAADTGDAGSIPGLERTPGAGNGSPVHYACLENSMNKGAWWAAAYQRGRKVSDTTERRHELYTHGKQCLTHSGYLLAIDQLVN